MQLCASSLSSAVTRWNTAVHHLQHLPSSLTNTHSLSHIVTRWNTAVCIISNIYHNFPDQHVLFSHNVTKWDTAVYIIYHNFPDQRTLIFTHCDQVRYSCVHQLQHLPQLPWPTHTHFHTLWPGEIQLCTSAPASTATALTNAHTFSHTDQVRYSFVHQFRCSVPVT